MSLDSLRVEVDFDGSWTDVSAWLETKFGGGVQFGRTSEYSQAQSATLTLTLDNRDGRFTPRTQVYYPNGRDKAAQPHPYWPNVVPRRPIRLSYVVAGTAHARFTGLVQGWPPSFDGDSPIVQVTASDYLSILSKMNLSPAVTTEVLADAPVAFWPMSDPADSVRAAEFTGGSWPALAVTGSGTALTFGSDGLDGLEASGVLAAPTGTGDGKYLHTEPGGLPELTAITLESWAKPANVAWDQVVADFYPVPVAGERGLTLWVQASDGRAKCDVLLGFSLVTYTGPVVNDGGWHHFAVTASATGDVQFYVDGVVEGSTAATILLTAPWAPWHLFVAQASTLIRPMAGGIGPVAIYDAALAAARVEQHYQAGRAFYGETVDERINRILGYVGIPGGTPYGVGLYGAGPYGGGVGIMLDTSTVTLSGYQQNGKDVLTACQDAVASEGGGAALYVTTDGAIRFTGREYRSPTSPTLTIVAGADDDASTFQPAYDDRSIVNTVDATRATLATSATIRTVTDPDSIDAYGTSADSVTSYAIDPDDVVHLAEERVATHAQPGYRLQQITVDMTTAQNDLWASVAATGIGDRVRVTSLPPTSAPTTIIDSLAEGWADRFDSTTYKVTFDTTAADNPARMVWDSLTYGRWAGEQNTLHATITSSATSIVVDTAVGLPLFTHDPADYPLDIRIDEEELTVTAAPGSSSPQTMAVTRGVNGTTAAAHTAGATVDVAVVPTWAL